MSKNAAQKKKYVIVESEAEKLYSAAETSFKNEEYLKALKSLVEIDKSYSQYSSVEEFIGECETILIAELPFPLTEEEYQDNQRKIDKYLKVVNSEVFIKKKNQMNREYDAFVTAAPILQKAENAFSAKDYEGVFSTLEKAKRDIDNHFIYDMLDDLHNTYVVGKAQEIKAEVEKKDYAKAMDIANEAISIYDCEELKSVRKYVLEEKHPSYKYYNYVVERITSTFSEWTSEEFDVKQARDDAGAYIVKSGKKMLLGDYDKESITVLSVTGEVATSLIGVDVPLDVRDLSYDITHWNEVDYFALRIATDTIALVPVVGAVKYLKHSKEAGKGIKTGAKTAEAVIGGTSKAARVANNIIDTSTDIGKNANGSAIIAKIRLLRYTRINTVSHRFAGKCFPGTKVMLKWKKVRYSDGRRLKGVFPVFDSKVTIKLPRDRYLSSFSAQQLWLCKRMQKMAKQGKLNKRFTSKELDVIKAGKIPDGYTWHHHEKEGWMQLVETDVHNTVKHSGGMSLWGKGYN